MEEEYQKVLNKVRDAVSFSDDEFGESKTSSNLDEELNLLEELVEKEKAMKPVLYEVNKYDDHFHKCPKCGCEIGRRLLKSTLFKYCSECGQKLDWRK